MVLTYEEWLAEMEEEVTIFFAEAGSDREVGFNLEAALEREYERYLEKQALQ